MSNNVKVQYIDSKERVALDLMTKIAESGAVISDSIIQVENHDKAYWLGLYAECLSTVRRTKHKS